MLHVPTPSFPTRRPPDLAGMVDHGLARRTRDNRVERPGDGPGEPGGTSLIGKRAEGIVALANVASLDPATIQSLVDLTPFLGGKRPALVAGQQIGRAHV